MKPDDRPACYGKPALFDSTKPAAHAAAARICAECPVIDACRKRLAEAQKDYGFDYHMGPRGTWAGILLAPERPKPRSGQRGGYYGCGTSAGYRRHRRAEQEPCASCRAAESAYSALRRKKAAEKRATKSKTTTTTAA